MIAPIMTPAEYEAAIARLLALMDLDDPGPELDDLSDAIEEYEAPRWGRSASLSIFTLILRIADRKRAAVQAAYDARRQAWRDDLPCQDEPRVRNPIIAWSDHEIWLRDHIDHLNNPALAAGLSERLGFDVQVPTLEASLRRLCIHRSPEASARMRGNRTQGKGAA